MWQPQAGGFAPNCYRTIVPIAMNAQSQGSEAYNCYRHENRTKSKDVTFEYNPFNQRYRKYRQ